MRSPSVDRSGGGLAGLAHGGRAKQGSRENRKRRLRTLSRPGPKRDLTGKSKTGKDVKLAYRPMTARGSIRVFLLVIVRKSAGKRGEPKGNRRKGGRLGKIAQQ